MYLFSYSLQGSWYHKNCFRCVDCSRLLDSLTNNDGPDGQLYCKVEIKGLESSVICLTRDYFLDTCTKTDWDQAEEDFYYILILSKNFC